ncbi:RNA polymerase sigma factor [Roseobacter sp. MED193]|uniref:hypothetical protein n=1 Tax=Roseobacter sp. MED193 TaxID=314262 RepID=UPI000068E0EB|nr:hypothetical protein [Roseobacter sp. MED193]EAQ45687.1 RNA polymerase sigma factor [Roseobacter sp. MED193]
MKRASQTQRIVQNFLRIRNWFLGAIVAVIGFVLLIPDKISNFVEDALRLKEVCIEFYISNWVKPQRWEALYSSYPEGYVNLKEMNLLKEPSVFLSLHYEPEYMKFDGELISLGFCEIGLPYKNILIRGYPSLWFRNQMKLVAYDVIEGETVEFGTISAVLETPVIELEGWIFHPRVRLAIDSFQDRDQLGTLCVN